MIEWLFPCLQLTSGEVWVQFNDGSQLVVQAGVSCITYTSPDGRITKYGIAVHYFFNVAEHKIAQPVLFARRYKENEKLPEHVKEKLHCLSTILGLLANPAAHSCLQPR